MSVSVSAYRSTYYLSICLSILSVYLPIYKYSFIDGRSLSQR